jgi:protein-tyrosine phosphatase/membrane-associated phospholipid phosphatase
MNGISPLPPRRVNAYRAAAMSALLSILFLGVYGFTNWFASTRSHVGTVYFEWERHIPFILVMIVPYMSIDLFFIAAPFLCRDADELRVLARRISMGVIVAGTCFLLFPLRFAFDRPSVDGRLGAVFNWFRAMDRPYNLLPSLHITLRTILAYHYALHTRGAWRAASHVWFSLIGFSTLFTYQHHLLDVAGGFVLAGYCFYAVRGTSQRLPVNCNRRVGSYYAIGALLVLALVVTLWPWGSLLLWVAVALGIVATAYFGAGPGIYRKSNGRLPLSTWWALGPCLLGQYLSLLYYRRQCRVWEQVTPAVWIGRKLSNREAADVVRQGVTAVLDLTTEFNEAKPFLALRYLNIPILDLTAPTQEQLAVMASFIAEQARAGVVYVHCKIGYSRSAAAVGAWLLASGQSRTVEETVARLRAIRPSIVIRPEVMNALARFAASRGRFD